jgi:cyclopropane fatty-acyl-phospholipid synthase-like methyltransferase
MLDKRMVYSCAYWEDAETLDEAAFSQFSSGAYLEIQKDCG